MADDRRRAGPMAGILLAIAFFAWLMVRHAPVRQDVASARAAAAGLAAERDRLAAERARLAAERARLASRLREREEVLAAERRRSIEIRSRLAVLTLPQADVTFLSLSPEHGAKPPHRVVLGSRPAWIVLMVEVPAHGGGPYSLTLFNPGGLLQWCGGGLRPSASGAVAVGLPSDFLTPGKYRLLISDAGMPPAKAETSFVVEQGR
jgi:hypothetical protein